MKEKRVPHLSLFNNAPVFLFFFFHCQAARGPFFFKLLGIGLCHQLLSDKRSMGSMRVESVP